MNDAERDREWRPRVKAGDGEDPQDSGAGDDQENLSAAGLGALVRADKRVNSRRIAELGLAHVDHRRLVPFDAAVIVLLSAADYAVWRASKGPRDVVESAAVHRQHVNGKVLLARPEVMGHPDATDLTATLQAAQTRDEAL